MAKLTLPAVLLLALTACRFDPTLPAGAGIVRCASTAECPSALVCQTSLGRCVERASFDETPPTLTGVPRAELRPNAMYAVDFAPTAMGPAVNVEVTFVVSEALSQAPLLSVESAVALTCTLFEPIAQEYRLRCLTAGGAVGTGEALIRATLIDGVQQSTTVELARFAVDAEAPPAVPTRTREQALLSIRPWGDSVAGASASTLLLQPCLPDQRVLRLTPMTSGGTQGLTRFELCRQNVASLRLDFGPDLIGVSVKAFDGAGNGSPEADVHWVDVTVSARKTPINASPHSLRPVAVLPFGPLSIASLDAGTKGAWLSGDKEVLAVSGAASATIDFPGVESVDYLRFNARPENYTVVPSAHDTWSDETFRGAYEWWSGRRLSATNSALNVVELEQCENHGETCRPVTTINALGAQRLDVVTDVRGQRSFLQTPVIDAGVVTAYVFEWQGDAGLVEVGRYDCGTITDPGYEFFGGSVLRLSAGNTLYSECGVIAYDFSAERFVTTLERRRFDRSTFTSSVADADAGLAFYDLLGDTFIDRYAELRVYARGDSLGYEPEHGSGLQLVDGGLMRISANGNVSAGTQNWQFELTGTDPVSWHEAARAPIAMRYIGPQYQWVLADGGLRGPAFGASTFLSIPSAVTPRGATVGLGNSLYTLNRDGQVVATSAPPRTASIAYDLRSDRLWAVTADSQLYRGIADGGFVAVPVFGEALVFNGFQYRYSSRFDELVRVGSNQRVRYASERPAVLLDVVPAALPQLGVPAQSIELVFSAAGRGRSESSDVSGVHVGVWAGPAFERLSFSADDAGMSHALVPNATFEKLKRYRPAWTFAVTPAGSNGDGQAVLEVDSVELVAHFFKP